MNEELKLIKKHYGEKMMQLCRTLFPTILEEENKLLSLLLNNFEPNHSLYEDLDVYGKTNEFKDFIYGLTEKKEEIIDVSKKPEELMSEAGYILYSCKSEEDIQSFKKYYKKDETLCTFTTNRLDRCHVFFAVKKDVNSINREDFTNPERQDKYGTSVISIQFTKDPSNTLSIKNRYNHRVINPDATFSNNLENIIPGLSESFSKYYGLKQSSNSSFEIPSYVRAKDGKYYKYNYEINNIYYCPDNIIIDNFTPRRLVKDKYILIDYFILDLQNKNIKLYDNKIKESFHNDIEDITKIEIVKDSYKNIKLSNPLGETILKLDQNNVMVELYSNSINKISDNFLDRNKFLKKINLINLSSIGNGFLYNNETLQKLEAPNLKTVGVCFLNWNVSLRELIVPKIEIVGDDFLYNNHSLQKLEAPNLKTVSSNFLYYNESLNELVVPNLEVVGDDFLYNNHSLQKLEAPNLETVDSNFLHLNETLKEFIAPNLQEVGDCFLDRNLLLKSINTPKLEVIKGDFLASNKALKILELPNLITVDSGFLCHNNELEYFDAPKLEKVGSHFLTRNKLLKELNAPNLREVGTWFLSENEIIETNFSSGGIKR